MAQTPFKTRMPTRPDSRYVRKAFLGLVREGCDTLLLTHPSVVESLTVSRSFGDDESARLAARMATHLAEEYDLDADARIDSMTVIVRLSRNGNHIHLKRNGDRRHAGV